MVGAAPNDEQALVRQLRRGDEAALAVFSEAFLNQVYGFVYYRVAGDEQAAEDVTQETFLGALDALEHFDGRSRLFTWLCAIARHKLADYFRRRTRLEEARAALEEPPAPEPDPADWVEREERRRQILAVLRMLPARYQHALTLKYLDRLSGKELAVALELSEDATESLLARARVSFRRAFRESDAGTTGTTDPKGRRTDERP